MDGGKSFDKVEREVKIRMDSIEVMQSKVEVFNCKHPVGSPVAVIKDFGEIVETKVKHSAEILEGHTAVVWLEGISSAYLLNRVIG